MVLTRTMTLAIMRVQAKQIQKMINHCVGQPVQHQKIRSTDWIVIVVENDPENDLKILKGAIEGKLVEKDQIVQKIENYENEPKKLILLRLIRKMILLILMSHTSVQIVRRKDMTVIGFNVHHAKFGFARNACQMLNVICTTLN